MTVHLSRVQGFACNNNENCLFTKENRRVRKEKEKKKINE